MKEHNRTDASRAGLNDTARKSAAAEDGKDEKNIVYQRVDINLFGTQQAATNQNLSGGSYL